MSHSGREKHAAKIRRGFTIFALAFVGLWLVFVAFLIVIDPKTTGDPTRSPITYLIIGAISGYIAWVSVRGPSSVRDPAQVNARLANRKSDQGALAAADRPCVPDRPEHDFDDKGVCAKCGCSRGFVERFGFLCDGDTRGAAKPDEGRVAQTEIAASASATRQATSPEIELGAASAPAQSMGRCANCGGHNPTLYAVEYGWLAEYNWDTGGAYRQYSSEERYLKLGDAVAPICDACIGARRKFSRLLSDIALGVAGVFIIGFVVWSGVFESIGYDIASAPRRFGEFMDDHVLVSVLWVMTTCVVALAFAARFLLKHAGDEYELEEKTQTGANMAWRIRKADIEREFAKIDPHYDFYPGDKRVPYGEWEDFYEKRETDKRNRVHYSKQGGVTRFAYSIVTKNPRRLGLASELRGDD